MKKILHLSVGAAEDVSLWTRLQSWKIQRQQVWIQRNHYKTPIQYWGCRVLVHEGVWHSSLPAAALESPLDVTEVSGVSQASVSLQVIHQSRHCSVIVLTDGIEVQLRIPTCTGIKTGALEQVWTLWSTENMATCKTELVCFEGKYFYVKNPPTWLPFGLKIIAPCSVFLGLFLIIFSQTLIRLLAFFSFVFLFQSF